MITRIYSRFATHFFLAAILWTNTSAIFLPNLSEVCYRCLCHASTGCQTPQECNDFTCGPFNISFLYWIHADKPILPNDDPKRDGAWQDCARDYECSKRIVEGYLQKFAKDCNGDGVTDCYDYLLINGNGGYLCTLPLNTTQRGRQWLERYEECKTYL